MRKGKYCAVIFDLDGTIIDSEPNYYLADKNFMQIRGLNFTEEDHKEYQGIGSLKFINIMKQRHGFPESAEVLLAQKDRLYLELARRKTRVFPEMEKLIKSLATQGYPLAVASGSSGDLIHELLVQTNMRDYFKLLVSAEEVEHGKPAPDIFYEAARRLDVSPEKCLVLEDSRFGVEAALAAGMGCVAIPGGKTDAQCFYRATLFFPGGMREFSACRVLDLM